MYRKYFLNKNIFLSKPIDTGWTKKMFFIESESIKLSQIYVSYTFINRTHNE